MENTVALQEYDFKAPSFGKRVKSLMKLDFYRLFHSPVLYVFLVIAALIPALVLTMGQGTTDPTTGEFVPPAYEITNTWQMIAAWKPTYVISDMGEYANINMIYIFGGIMLSIFISHDYMSGFVKNIFTVHAKKQDYVISKIAIGAFSMICMVVMYIIGSVACGIITDKSFDINVGSLICCILSKMALCFGFSALFTLMNVIFRRLLPLSIIGCFFFGCGLLVMAAAMMMQMAGGGMSAALNVFLYGSACYASLSANVLTIVVCAVCSAAWTAIYILLATFILKKRDLV